MRKHGIIAIVAAVALSLPLMACGSEGQTASAGAGSNATEQQGAADEDLAKFFAGTWRASVATEGNTVYGNVSGKEKMLDVILTEDGSATVTPLEGHEDLLTDEGTWEAADDTAVTLRLSSGDITLAVIDDATLEGTAADFGIDGFDTLEFEYY